MSLIWPEIENPNFMSQKINQAGIDIIKKWETFKARPYICPTGHPSIGYGTTVYPNGRKVTLRDAPITEAQAVLYMMDHIERIIYPPLNAALRVKLNDNRYSALVSFIYNVGVGRPRLGGKREGFLGSTLLQVINQAPGAPGIRTEFAKWNKGTVNGRRVVLPGLVSRRKDEADLYFKV